MVLACGSTPDGSPRVEAHVAPTPTPLDEALAAASLAGKPVFVMVVAPSLEERRRQARWFDDLLEVGDANLLEDLALVEVACATRGQIEARLGHNVRLEADEELGLFEEVDGRWTWQPIALTVRSRWGSDLSWAPTLERQLKRTADELRAVLRGSDEQFARRLALSRSRLEVGEVETCDELVVHHNRPSRILCDRGAWIFRAAVDVDPDRRGHLRALAHRVVEARLIAHAPFGARWVNGYPDRSEVEFASRDDAEERRAYEARADEVRALGTALRAFRPVVDTCAGGGPCGTGFTDKFSHKFLEHYVRYLVMVPDDG